mgnify:CR=1 FL=1
MLVPGITHLTIKVTLMQIYITAVRRRYLRLRVQSCAAPPVGRPAVIEQADLGQRSLSKIYLGGSAPAAAAGAATPASRPEHAMRDAPQRRSE